MQTEGGAFQLTRNRYERILDRIRLLEPRESALAKKLLQWMTCATRDLTLRELEDAMAIQADGRMIDGANRPFGSKLKQICGPIVEIVGEDTMSFVHFSAKE